MPFQHAVVFVFCCAFLFPDCITLAFQTHQTHTPCTPLTHKWENTLYLIAHKCNIIIIQLNLAVGSLHITTLARITAHLKKSNASQRLVSLFQFAFPRRTRTAHENGTQTHRIQKHLAPPQTSLMRTNLIWCFVQQLTGHSTRQEGACTFG